MTQPAPDERRVRYLLRRAGVGPDADEQPLPTLPPGGLPPGYEPAPAPWSWDAYFAGLPVIE
ncbi:hypothetical protein ACOKM5_23330 [Streptomyces sp. BH097]|uniref:hypothetical protein n=1 Tax=unclassified Streptomyces TaxID=2593676 RepID=UPI003BB7D59E